VITGKNFAGVLAGEQLDKILACLKMATDKLDSFGARMDAMEGAMMDSAKKDAAGEDEGKIEEEGDPKELKADRAKKDGAEAAMIGDSDNDLLAKVQSRADHVASAHGLESRRPYTNEDVDSYRRRAARPFQKFSKTREPVDLKTLAGPALEVATDQVFADAVAAATDNSMYAETGNLHCKTRRGENGHTIREYYVDPMAWMQTFTGQRRLARFNLSKRGD
jgi:hypothetical protein